MNRAKFTLVEPLPIVEIRGLSKQFDDVQALDDITIDIPRGKIIGLLGPNGSGKTTFLKILAGMCMDYEGEVSILGNEPGAITKAQVAYLPDKCKMPEAMPVSEMIKVHKTFFEDFDEQKCRELLGKFGIKEDATTKTMSKGVVDKLLISLMMARRAKLYLLDEPLGGVDVEAREHVLDIILDNFNPEGTMIIVTHLIRDIDRLFDTVAVLKKGQITTFEECDKLRARYGSTLEEAMKELFRGDM